MNTVRPLRIGIVAPPWVPVPPPAYGGTELVLDDLARGLARLGHEVTLFTIGDSTCPVRRRWLFPHGDPDRMGAAVLELRHVAAAHDALCALDIVHDHTVVGPFLAQRLDLPTVTTNHGPFDDDLADLYRRISHRVPLIAISESQASLAPHDVRVATVIHHGIDLDRYPFEGSPGSYLLFVGRMNQTKGIDTAIAVAERVGLPLLIAAKMREPAEHRYFEEVIRPRLGHGIDYVGEVDLATKVELMRNALALLNPIRWPEPFGLVMVEAMACGTPVVATPQGAAPEIVEDGHTGALCTGVDDLAWGVEFAATIDRETCRRSVERHFSMDRMAVDHEDFYRRVLRGRAADELDLRRSPRGPDGGPSPEVVLGR